MNAFTSWFVTADLVLRIGEGAYPDLPYPEQAYSMLQALNLCPDWLLPDTPRMILGWWIWINSEEGQADLIRNRYTMPMETSEDLIITPLDEDDL